MGATVIMADESLREKLDQLNEKITDRMISRIGGEDTEIDDEGNETPVKVSNDDLRVALQLLKQNNISAAAMPDNPMDRMQQMIKGLRITPGVLEARQRALPHLLPVIEANAADSAAALEPPKRKP